MENNNLISFTDLVSMRSECKERAEDLGTTLHELWQSSRDTKKELEEAEALRKILWDIRKCVDAEIVKRLLQFPPYSKPAGSEDK